MKFRSFPGLLSLVFTTLAVETKRTVHQIEPIEKRNRNNSTKPEFAEPGFSGLIESCFVDAGQPYSATLSPER